MPAAHEFVTHVIDLLQPFGPCEARRMFGGFGIFHQGLMFGLISEGSLYLKTDAETRSLFTDEGATPFSYYRQGKECRLSYYLAPEQFFEDSEACQRWAGLAFDAALRNPNKRKSGG